MIRYMIIFILIMCLFFITTVQEGMDPTNITSIQLTSLDEWDNVRATLQSTVDATGFNRYILIVSSKEGTMAEAVRYITNIGEYDSELDKKLVIMYDPLLDPTVEADILAIFGLEEDVFTKGYFEYGIDSIIPDGIDFNVMIKMANTSSANQSKGKGKGKGKGKSKGMGKKIKDAKISQDTVKISNKVAEGSKDTWNKVAEGSKDSWKDTKDERNKVKNFFKGNDKKKKK